MATIEELVNLIKKEVDDELIEKLNENNIEVDLKNKIEGKRKHIIPDTNTDVHGTIIKRSKRNDHDSPGVIVNELKPCYPDLFIYTTRLNEMCLFKRDFKKLNPSDIWEEILRESKPVYSQHKHDITTQTIIKDKNIQKLCNDLKIINDKESLNVFGDEKLCQAKENNEEMKDISTNKNHRQINVNMFKLKVYKRNSLLIDDTSSSDKSKEILNNSNNQIVSSDISEGTLLFRRENNSNKELATVSPESEVLETNKSIMELRKSEIQDPKALLTSLCCSIVYTTRLDDMRLLRNNLRYVDGKYLLNEILRESKPNVKNCKHSTSPFSVNKNNFKRLKLTLKILNNKNRQKYGDKRAPKYLNFNLIPSDFFIRITSQSVYAKILVDPKMSNNAGDYLYSTVKKDFFAYIPKIRSVEKVEVHQNISLFIYNKFLDLIEVFVTDDNGNITELRRFKYKNTSELNEFIKNIDPHKQKMKLTTCCWFHRNMNIDKVWSNTIARFLKSSHPCLPVSCKCCCKPHLGRNTKTYTNIEVDNALNNIKHNKNSLIGRALDFRKPIQEIKTNKHDTEIRPLMIELNKNDRIEHYAIDSKGRIEWQFALHPKNQTLDKIPQLKNKSSMTLFKEYINSKQDQDDFMSKLKTRNVPLNIIKYLKSTTVSPHSSAKVMPTTKLKLIKNIQDVEHTRTYTLAPLIKIRQILNPNSMLKRRPTFQEGKISAVNKIGAKVSGTTIGFVPSNSGLNSPLNRTISGKIFKRDPDLEDTTNMYDNFSHHRLPLQYPPSRHIYNPTTSKSIKQEVDIQDGDETKDNIFNDKSFESFIKIENNNTDIVMPIISKVLSLNDSNATNEFIDNNSFSSDNNLSNIVNSGT